MNGSEKPKILIAEDDTDLRNMLAEALGQEYDVTGVASGDKALQLLIMGTFDILLTDMGMPGMTGEEVVRALSPEIRKRLIIIFSTGQSRDELASLLEDGVLGRINHCKKPDLTGVKKAIEKELALRSMEAEGSE